MVKPARLHTRFERARIIGARALQIGMGAPLYAKEDELREEFKAELISLYGLEEASVRFVLDPLKIAVYEYDNELIPIDIDPHLDDHRALDRFEQTMLSKTSCSFRPRR